MKQSYGQFCPVAQTAEILCARWVPLIIRELCYGSRTFGELAGAIPLMSRTLLTQRLKDLSRAGVVSLEPHPSRRGHVYTLTEAGGALRPIIAAMSEWAQRWVMPSYLVDVGEVDPKTLMWAMRSYVERSDMPPDTFLVRFEFRGPSFQRPVQRYWWLLLRDGEIEVCAKEPLHDVDVVIEADIAEFLKVWMGYQGVKDAVSHGYLKMTGLPRATDMARRILKLSDIPTERTFLSGPEERGAGPRQVHEIVGQGRKSESE